MFALSKTLPSHLTVTVPVQFVCPICTFNPSIPVLVSNSSSLGTIKRKIHTLHPELLYKMYYQKLSSSLCSYYSSEEYKERLDEYVRRQKQILVECSEKQIPKKAADYLKTKVVPRSKVKKEERELQDLKTYDDDYTEYDQNEVKPKRKAITIMEYILHQKKDEFKRRKLQGASVI